MLHLEVQVPPTNFKASCLDCKEPVISLTYGLETFVPVCRTSHIAHSFAHIQAHTIQRLESLGIENANSLSHGALLKMWWLNAFTKFARCTCSKSFLLFSPVNYQNTRVPRLNFMPLPNANSAEQRQGHTRMFLLTVDPGMCPLQQTQEHCKNIIHPMLKFLLN